MVTAAQALTGAAAAASNSNRKRKRTATTYNTFLENASGEWVLNVTVASQIVLGVLRKLSIGYDAKILIPGVGYSKLSVSLFEAGYVNLTLADIEESAIQRQQEYFRDLLANWLADHPQDAGGCGVQTVLGDLFDDTGPADALYDVIIDKSFLDVFLRQGSSRKIMQQLAKKLNPQTGVFISISMFHRKWRYLLSRSLWDVKYTSVQVERFSRTRPTIKQFAAESAVLVAVHRQLETTIAVSPAALSLGEHLQLLHCVDTFHFHDFYSLPVDAFPLDASSF